LDKTDGDRGQRSCDSRYPGGQTPSQLHHHNRLDGAQERIFGTGGSVVLTHTEAIYIRSHGIPLRSAAEMTLGTTYHRANLQRRTALYRAKGETPPKRRASDAVCWPAGSSSDCIRAHRQAGGRRGSRMERGSHRGLVQPCAGDRTHIKLADFSPEPPETPLPRMGIGTTR